MSLQHEAQKLNLDLGIYTDLTGTLSRLEPHFAQEQDLVLVGSLANRAQFPEFYQGRATTVGDIDLVMQPPLTSTPVATSLAQNFALMGSYIQFEGYSLFLTDRDNLNSVNVFVGERRLETDEVVIDGQIWKVPTKVEILLKVMRDIFTFDAKHTPGQKGWQLPEKHRILYNYMVAPKQANILGAYSDDIERMWETEVSTLEINLAAETEEQNKNPDRRFEPRIRQFTTFQEYLRIISEIISIDENFLPEGEKQTLVGKITEDGREEHGLQKPWGLEPVSSEEYISIKNAINEKKN